MQSYFNHPSHKIKYSLYFIGLILIAVTLILGYKNGMANSSDLMWYPTKLLWSGVNPYTAFLSKGLEGWSSFSVPNYAPLLYVILYPLGLLDFEEAKIVWFFVNVLSFFGIIMVSCKKLKVPLWLISLVLIILLLNNPVVTTFNIAQNSLLISFVLLVAWAYRKNTAVLIITLSILFVKYSFGLPIIFGFFLAGYRKEALCAVGINIAVYFLFAQYFNIGFLEALLLPLKVAQVNTLHFLGDSDWMSLMYYVTDQSLASIIIPIGLLLAFAVFLYLCYHFNPSEESIISASVILSLICFFHLNYDSVILVIPLFTLIGKFKKITPEIALLLIFSCLIWLPGSILRILKLFMKFDISSYLVHEYRFGVLYEILVILFGLYVVLRLIFSEPQRSVIGLKD